MKIYWRALLLTASFCSHPALAATPQSAQTQSAPDSLPSVRGLEYHRVLLYRTAHTASIQVQFSYNLWITPAHNGQPARGMGWDGVVYDLERVGPRVDWHADVIEALRAPSENEARPIPQPYEFSPTPVSIHFLEQLNDPALLKRARMVAKALKVAHPRDTVTTYQYNLRTEGVTAFSNGDFRQAKRQLQTLLSVLPAEGSQDISHLRSEANAILTDIERRSQKLPKSQDEIAALISELQNERYLPEGYRGANYWGPNSTVTKLVALGDAGVEPLFEALNDPRLTLSLRDNPNVDEGFFRVGSPRTIGDAAFAILPILFRHTYYEPDELSLMSSQRRAAIEAEMRADWEAVKGVPPVERVFETLATSGQSPRRLVEAAQRLFESTARWTNFGEPLRAHSNPSVSDLLEARIKELNDRALNGRQMAQVRDTAATMEPKAPDDVLERNRIMRAANILAGYYAKWDVERAAPLLGAQLELSKQYVATLPADNVREGQRFVRLSRHLFLGARRSTPFKAEALREYGAYLQSQPFGQLNQDEYYELSYSPSNPDLMRAAHVLFDAPRKLFQDALQSKSSRGYRSDYLCSPLLKNPVFRAAVVRELGNNAVVATLRATKGGKGEIQLLASKWRSSTFTLPNSRLEPGKSQPLRVCDLAGFSLYKKRPVRNYSHPDSPLLDIALPRRERDTQLARIIALVKAGRVADDNLGIIACFGPRLEL